LGVWPSINMKGTTHGREETWGETGGGGGVPWRERKSNAQKPRFSEGKVLKKKKKKVSTENTPPKPNKG